MMSGDCGLLTSLLRWVAMTGRREEKELVNEESEDDEGYSSITGQYNSKRVSMAKQRRNKIREQDLKIVEEDSKEILMEKFMLLRDAYDQLKDEMTKVEYENESLKDCQEEREQEMRLQRTELLQLTDRLKVLQKAAESDKNVIANQQQIIDNYARLEVKAPD